MARWQGTTKERGYDSRHQRIREARLLVYRPGDICADGGEPLMYWPLEVARKYLHLPHTADRTGYKPGLSCQHHNCGDGARRGNRRRGQRRMVLRASRDWLYPSPPGKT